MKDYAIITDSGCDLSKEMVEELGVDVVPMKLLLDGVDYRHYHDFRELSMETFFSKLREGHIGQTSCVSTGDIMEAMIDKVKKGLDVLYLSFSSGMSGSYNSAVLAANNVKEEYPEANIEVIDTKAGSVGLGMLTYLASKRKALGESLSQVAKYVVDNCQNICHYFMVEDLKFIHKTGRISTIGMIAGTAIGVKPIFKLSEEGKVALDAKVRGTKSALRTMAEKVVSKCTDASKMFICHVDAKDNAESLASKIKETYPGADIEVGPCGPIIGNNTGPGAVAVIFYGDAR